MVGPGRPQFVLFGSSIVQMSLVSGGWGSILGDLYDRKADIILRGYYGWNSRNALEVLNKIFPQDAAVHPSLAIVYFGGNDASQPHPSGLGSHVPLPEYVENMRKIAFHLKSLGEKLRIIFLTTPPVHEGRILQYYGNKFDKQERTNEACRAYSEALVELCKQMDIKVIDLWKGFQHRDDWGAAYLRRIRPLQCDEENMRFMEVGSIRLPAYAETLEIKRDGVCELVCRVNCSCTAYAYRNGYECLLFTGGVARYT